MEIIQSFTLLLSSHRDCFHIMHTIYYIRITILMEFNQNSAMMGDKHHKLIAIYSMKNPLYFFNNKLLSTIILDSIDSKFCY